MKKNFEIKNVYNEKYINACNNKKIYIYIFIIIDEKLRYLLK